MQIEIGDDDSGCLIAQLKLTHRNFARAVFSHSHTPAEGRMGNVHRVGTIHEWKSEIVPIPLLHGDHMDRDDPRIWAIIQSAVKEFEVDGWEASIKDAFNHHNHISTEDHMTYTVTNYKIGFDRWVPKKETA